MNAILTRIVLSATLLAATAGAASAAQSAKAARTVVPSHVAQVQTVRPGSRQMLNPQPLPP